MHEYRNVFVCIHAHVYCMTMQGGKTALDVATSDSVRAVLRQHGAKHSLFYAVEEKMLELVEDLIKEGADVNYKNHVSLHRVLSASVCIDGYVNDSSHGNVNMHWRVGHTCARCAYVSLSL